MMQHHCQKLRTTERIYHFGAVDLNVLSCGDPTKQAMIFLHGFPSYSGQWLGIMTRFADDAWCLAPDLRGYHGSSRPVEPEAYSATQYADDIIALAMRVSPDAPVVLVGHDCGGWVAYMVAIKRPDLIEALVVLNGAHPGAFAEALSHDPDQTNASQYVTKLRHPQTASYFAANDCAQMLESYKRAYGVGEIETTISETLIESWSRDGAIDAMLNWYRANDIIIPSPDDNTAPIHQHSSEELRVHPRHLLIWGERDPYLRPSVHMALQGYCEDLTKAILPEAGHWPPATDRDVVINLIKQFLA